MGCAMGGEASREAVDEAQGGDKGLRSRFALLAHEHGGSAAPAQLQSDAMAAVRAAVPCQPDHVDRLPSCVIRRLTTRRCREWLHVIMRQ